MAEQQENKHIALNIGKRALIMLRGYEAENFLDGIITANMRALPEKELRPAALLSPQGKILFDFLIARLPQTGGDKPFQIDIAADLAADFIPRLTMYKLRRAIEVSAPRPVTAHISDSESAGSWRDMRFPAACPIWRSYGDSEGEQTQAQDAQKWNALRISCCVPEGGRDFPLGDTFPHDVNYDALGAVSFNKGCYIGQEVVSRMQHKAEIRKRLVRAEWAQYAPEPTEGAEITAGGKIIGRLGTVCGNQGLALVRTDKIPQAGDAEQAKAGETALHFTAPAYLPDILAPNKG